MSEETRTNLIGAARQTPTLHHYLGYPSLEEMLEKARGDGGPLYVSLLRTPTFEIDVGEPMIYVTVVTVSSVTAERHVRYWRKTLAKTLFLHGEPFDENADRHHARSRAAYELLLEYLAEEGFATEHAVVAVPRDLRLTEGKAAFWRYEQSNDRFERVRQLAS